MLETLKTTTLGLLTSDGAISVTFKPALLSEQYDDLLRVALAEVHTRSELRDLLCALAEKWGIECIVDC